MSFCLDWTSILVGWSFKLNYLDYSFCCLCYRLAFPHEASPIQLHGDMFLPTLTRQGTEEQVNKYLPLAEKYQIIGTYAQTEMGHGMCRLWILYTVYYSHFCIR